MRKLTEREAKVLEMIILDLEGDATSLDGKPFNANTVADTFGTLMATVHALAKLVRCMNDGEFEFATKPTT